MLLYLVLLAYQIYLNIEEELRFELENMDEWFAYSAFEKEICHFIIVLY